MSMIAATILEQLGGSRFAAMTGAKMFMAVAEGRGLSFQLGRTANKANRVRITLTPADEYLVEFTRYVPTTLSVEPISAHDSIHAEDLRPLIEEQTGLRTSL